MVNGAFVSRICAFALWRSGRKGRKIAVPLAIEFGAQVPSRGQARDQIGPSQMAQNRRFGRFIQMHGFYLSFEHDRDDYPLVVNSP